MNASGASCRGELGRSGSGGGAEVARPSLRWVRQSYCDVNEREVAAVKREEGKRAFVGVWGFGGGAFCSRAEHLRDDGFHVFLIFALSRL